MARIASSKTDLGSSQKSQFHVVDLFAGVGGLSYGFAHSKDFKVLAANEILPPMAEAYRLNHPTTKMFEVGRSGNLLEYNVQAVTQGHDALGEVTLKVDFGDGRLITGKGASTDVIEASARAYLNAINRTFIRRELGEQAQGV